MVANKVHGVRCALCWNLESARLSRQHNDANVLSLGEQIDRRKSRAGDCAVWLTTEFEGGRHRAARCNVKRNVSEFDSRDRRSCWSDCSSRDLAAVRVFISGYSMRSAQTAARKTALTKAFELKKARLIEVTSSSAAERCGARRRARLRLESSKRSKVPPSFATIPKTNQCNQHQKMEQLCESQGGGETEPNDKRMQSFVAHRNDGPGWRRSNQTQLPNKRPHRQEQAAVIPLDRFARSRPRSARYQVRRPRKKCVASVKCLVSE